MALTLSEAIAYVDKGIDKAKEMGIGVSLALIDEFGQLVQLDRMEGASLMTPDVAEAKAVTALNFKRPTSRLAQEFQDHPNRLSSIQQAVHFNVLALGGGIPIFKDGELVGAIGVSGATAEQDEEVANHAVS